MSQQVRPAGEGQGQPGWGHKGHSSTPTDLAATPKPQLWSRTTYVAWVSALPQAAVTSGNTFLQCFSIK